MDPVLYFDPTTFQWVQSPDSSLTNNEDTERQLQQKDKEIEDGERERALLLDQIRVQKENIQRTRESCSRWDPLLEKGKYELRAKKAELKDLQDINATLVEELEQQRRKNNEKEETIQKLIEEKSRIKQLEKYCFLYYWLHTDCHVSLETPARTYISIHPPDTTGFQPNQLNVVQSLEEDIKRLGNPTEIMPLVGLNLDEIDEWYKTIDVHIEQRTEDYRMLETALVKGSDDFKNYLAKHKPSIPNKICPLDIYSAAWDYTLTNCDSSRWHKD